MTQFGGLLGDGPDRDPGRRAPVLRGAGPAPRRTVLVLAWLVAWGCGTETVEPGIDLSEVRFDTTAVVGALAGDGFDVFGFVSGVALSGTGHLAVLDLQGRRVSVFDPDGAFVDAVGDRGEGPGEVDFPRLVEWRSDDELLVFDPSNGRVSVFTFGPNGLEFVESERLDLPAESACVLDGRVFMAAYEEEAVVHEIRWGGEGHRSFAAPLAIEGIDGLGPFRELALRQWATGRLLCDAELGGVLDVGTLSGALRLLNPDGTEVWRVRPEDIHPLRPVVEDGAFLGQADATTGSHVAQSAVRWDPEHVLIQYEIRFPGPRSEERDHDTLESRLIEVETGEEVARSTELPLLVAADGNRFVTRRNRPFPQLAILVRTLP